MPQRLKNFLSSSFTWSALFSLLAFVLFAVLQFKTHRNFDFYEGGTIAATVFATVINVSLLVKILSLLDNELGMLQPDKAAIVFGITAAIFYGGTDILKGFGKFYDASSERAASPNQMSVPMKKASPPNAAP